MELQVVPRPSDGEVAAIERALVLAGVRLVEGRSAFVGQWRRAAAREAVEPLPLRSSYETSPRRTRGATRA